MTLINPASDEARSPFASWGRAPSGLIAFVIATSWRHQFLLVTLTVAIFLLEVVPLELQRRIVNDVVKHRSYTTVLMLAIGYLGVVVLQGSVKLGLNVYRAWVGERAKRDLRMRIHMMPAHPGRAAIMPDADGTAITMTVAEVEPVGNFVGASLSEPLLQTGILASVIVYIVHIDLWMGMAALTLFVPQLIFVPLMQHAMNQRSGERVGILRALAAAVIGREPNNRTAPGLVERVFGANMEIFKLKFTMNFLMNLCSHLQVITALLLGAWWVLRGELELGGVVAFLSGLARLNDPWGDLVNYFRELSNTRVKFRLLSAALQAPDAAPVAQRGQCVN